MIASKYKVPRLDIPVILEKGREYASRLFIVRSRKNSGQFCRYRVIVSRKMHRHAVKRNRLRRQIYEAIRLNTSKEQHGKDIILIPKKITLVKKYADISADIKKIIDGETK